MSAITLTNADLLAQLENMLVKYGHADALSDYRRRLECKKAINRLVEELLRRGIDLPYVRTIE